MRKLILLIFAWCAGGLLYAQDSLVVRVHLVDDQHADPIHNVHAEIKVNDSLLTAISNLRGDIFFQAPAGASLDFSFRHFRFNPVSGKRKLPVSAREDTVSYTFSMEFIRTQDLDTMVVAAPGVPLVVFDSPRLHVSDFELLPNGDLLLLTYPKQLKKGSQILLFDGRNIRSNIEVEDVAEELVHDFRFNPHVVCENTVLGVYVKEDELLLGTLEKDYFLKYIAPILDTNKSRLYFSNFTKLYPAFDYFSFDRIDSAYTRILGIEDELMMELYRSEYKWVDVRTKLWAKNKEIETGVDAEIWVGMNYFTQTVYYKELYAPMFHRNDSLFVFDYYKDYLRVFDQFGAPIDSVPVFHHYDKRRTGWQNNLIQDRVTGQIYAVFDRAGYTYLGWVDTKTGEINRQVKLEYRYAQGVQVFNNYAYYIYRPFESAQKKYLYKERLPYDFGGSVLVQGDIEVE